MEIREARQTDIDEILELVNGVFCRSHHKPNTMGSQFPYLFSEKNVNHLYVAVDRQKVVSHVGFYSTKAAIEGVPVTIASIGSVATDDSYRNQGLSTQLLQKAFTEMKEKLIDIVLVSGARGLYQRNGYYSVGKTHWYVSAETTADTKNEAAGLRHVPKEELFETAIVEKLVAFENNEKTSFVRSVEEFKILFDAAGYCRIFPWRQELYVIERDQEIVAYFIVGFETMTNCQKRAHIIEFYGNRNCLAEGFLQLAVQPATEVIVPVLDHEQQLGAALSDLGFKNQETQTYPGTIKLPNPLLFWSKFKRHLMDSHENTHILEVSNGERYQLYINDELQWEGNEEQFTQWVFSHLPLPWPNGLNYI